MVQRELQEKLKTQRLYKMKLSDFHTYRVIDFQAHSI